MQLQLQARQGLASLLRHFWLRLKDQIKKRSEPRHTTHVPLLRKVGNAGVSYNIVYLKEPIHRSLSYLAGFPVWVTQHSIAQIEPRTLEKLRTETTRPGTGRSTMANGQQDGSNKSMAVAPSGEDLLTATVAPTEDEWDEDRLEKAMMTLKEMHIQVRSPASIAPAPFLTDAIATWPANYNSKAACTADNQATITYAMPILCHCSPFLCTLTTMISSS